MVHIIVLQIDMHHRFAQARIMHVLYGDTVTSTCGLQFPKLGCADYSNAHVYTVFSEILIMCTLYFQRFSPYFVM